MSRGIFFSLLSTGFREELLERGLLRERCCFAIMGEDNQKLCAPNPPTGVSSSKRGTVLRSSPKNPCLSSQLKILFYESPAISFVHPGSNPISMTMPQLHLGCVPVDLEHSVLDLLGQCSLVDRLRRGRRTVPLFRIDSGGSIGPSTSRLSLCGCAQSFCFCFRKMNPSRLRTSAPPPPVAQPARTE